MKVMDIYAGSDSWSISIWYKSMTTHSYDSLYYNGFMFGSKSVWSEFKKVSLIDHFIFIYELLLKMYLFSDQNQLFISSVMD